MSDDQRIQVFTEAHEAMAWLKAISGCLTVLGKRKQAGVFRRANPSKRAYSVGQTEVRLAKARVQRISGKRRRKFMSDPGLRRILARIPQNEQIVRRDL
jgi:hypothetical protein